MRILFLSDVDGTLVENNVVAPIVAEKAKEFVDKGNLFGLATGRHAFSMSWLAELLPINFPCVILSGACLYDTAEKKYKNPISVPDGIKDILAVIYERYPDMGIQVFTDDGLINVRLNAFQKAYGIAQEVSRPVMGLEAMEGKTILKIGLCCEDTSKLDEAADELLTDTSLYHWHYSHVIAGEICRAGVSKGNAVKEILAKEGIKPDLIAVAGDTENDSALFDIADVTFAPESAMDSIKARANYIIPRPEDGGVAKALEILMEKY